MILVGELQFKQTQKGSLKKNQASTGFEPVPPSELRCYTFEAEHNLEFCKERHSQIL